MWPSTVLERRTRQWWCTIEPQVQLWRAPDIRGRGFGDSFYEVDPDSDTNTMEITGGAMKAEPSEVLRLRVLPGSSIMECRQLMLLRETFECSVNGNV